MTILYQMFSYFTILFLLASQSTTAIKLDTKSESVIQLSQWVVKELQDLSDSGIYSTLSLHEVLSAEEEPGVFHTNTILGLSLASPYFKSGLKEEDYTVVVMKHAHEDYSTIAINEFPDMDENAIEEFYINKVEKKRSDREKIFQRWEASIN